MKLYTVRATRYLVGGEARELYTPAENPAPRSTLFWKSLLFFNNEKAVRWSHPMLTIES